MIRKLKTYNEITEYGKIARRYFVNNFYDGMLTILGILMGFFVILLKDPSESTIDSTFVILTGFGTAISMLISGISGSYLSERAEQKKDKKELDKAMGIFKEPIVSELSATAEQKAIERAMVTPIKNKIRKPLSSIRDKLSKEKKTRTLYEKAERFTGIIVSLVNGFSPFIGGVVPIIPFLFVAKAGISIFIISFIIILVCIILLGMFLGYVSQESILKNILQMSLAFFLTVIITVIFLG
ncbi:MAG: VIT1/CCC1 transporter family protein [Promethearchaeota archaeon]